MTDDAIVSAAIAFITLIDKRPRDMRLLQQHNANLWEALERLRVAVKKQ